jgi:hypothetical protein
VKILIGTVDECRRRAHELGIAPPDYRILPSGTSRNLLGLRLKTGDVEVVSIAEIQMSKHRELWRDLATRMDFGQTLPVEISSWL